jgi:signal peptidase I
MLWRRWVRPGLVAVILVIALRSSAADWNYVASNSMRPCFEAGDCVLVNKLAYDVRIPLTGTKTLWHDQPQRGEVVLLVAPDNGERLVKRIIGVPGDTVEIRDNALFVNDRPLACHQFGPVGQDGAERCHEAPRGDRYIACERIGERRYPVMFSPDQADERYFGPVSLPEGCYFVLGDNRDLSEDSRAFGAVTRDRIIGRVVAVTLSLRADGGLVSFWQRCFRRVS